MSTCGCAGSWQSAAFAFPAGSRSDPAERDPAAAGAPAPVGSAAGLPRVQPGAGRGAALVGPGAAAGQCQGLQGKQQRQGGLFLWGPLRQSPGSLLSTRKASRILACLGLAGSFRGHLDLVPTTSRDIFQQVRGLRALPDLSWDVSRQEAPPTSLGTLCQCFPTLLVKKFFL